MFDFSSAKLRQFELLGNFIKGVPNASQTPGKPGRDIRIVFMNMQITAAQEKCAQF